MKSLKSKSSGVGFGHFWDPILQMKNILIHENWNIIKYGFTYDQAIDKLSILCLGFDPLTIFGPHKGSEFDVLGLHPIYKQVVQDLVENCNAQHVLCL